MTEDRYRTLQREALTPEQQAVYDAVGAPRGGVVPAPFHVLLESPELGSLTQALGAFCRYRTLFPPRLSELLVLITAAHWQADYEFAVHSREAVKAGISQGVIDALWAHTRPELGDPQSELLFDFATAVYETHDVPDSLFERAVAQFGRKGVVELASVLGYYSSLAILLRIFRVPANA